LVVLLHLKHIYTSYVTAETKYLLLPGTRGE
jgi:hypothetical protein